MTRPGRPAEVRFYVDADLLGLAKILVQLRADVTYPGDPGGTVHRQRRPPCPVTDPAAPDPVWIPEVTRHGWLVVTRDANIAVHRAELAAVRDSGARMVALAGQQARGTFAQLEVLLCQWQRIEGLLDDPGPFIYTATRTSLRRLSLS